MDHESQRHQFFHRGRQAHILVYHPPIGKIQSGEQGSPGNGPLGVIASIGAALNRDIGRRQHAAQGHKAGCYRITFPLRIRLRPTVLGILRLLVQQYLLLFVVSFHFMAKRTICSFSGSLFFYRQIYVIIIEY